MHSQNAAACTDDLPAPLWRTARPDRPLTGLTVLLVEDSRFASEAVRLLCQRSGARIRRADCLRTATRHLMTYRPTVAIVDMGLPDGDGAALIARLNAAQPRVRVILGLSGEPGTEAAARAAGADGFLAKPLESLGHFQQTVLAALPAAEQPRGPRLVTSDRISPDTLSLREDLAHVAALLPDAADAGLIEYIARFLAGVARSSHDETLAAAVTGLAQGQREGKAITVDIARISRLLHERLAAH